MIKNTKYSAVLDVGSSKMTLVIGERGINSTFVFKAFAEESYSGFSEGEFFDEDELRNVIYSLYKRVKDESNVEIKELFVGVPGEFTIAITKEGQTSFKEKKKITEKDVLNLFESTFRIKNEKFKLINQSSVFFVLDDNRRVIDPVGLKSQKLGGYFSYVLAETTFTKLLENTFSKISDIKIEFISQALAESLYLIDAETRDRYALLLDIGFLTSTVMLIRGDGLLFLKSFSLGGGILQGNLVSQLEVDYEVSEKLKRKINLSCTPEKNSVYEVSGETDTFSYNINAVNKVCFDFLDEVSEILEECLAECKIKYPEYLTLFLTGGGISYMRGAKEYISKRINKVVEVLSPSLAGYNKPVFSSVLGLLDLAINQQEKKKVNLFKKLFS